MARYFITPDESFNVVCPFDIRDEENPQTLFLDPLTMHETLKAIPESRLEFQWIKFRRCTWGLDCYLRELAYSGSKSGMVQDRQFSPERFDEARLRYLTMESSFFKLADMKVSFGQTEGYPTLSADCEALLKRLGPVTLGIFLKIAAQVWNYGVPPSDLLTAEDYLKIRADKTALEQMIRRHDIPSLIEGKDAEKKEAKP